MKTLYRAYNRRTKEMIYDALEIKNIGLGDGSVVVHKDTQTGDELDWMQFTGLYDVDGRRIYEGDILETEFGRFEVYYRTALAGWYIRSCKGHIEFLAGSLGNRHTNKVIGNVLQNPELFTE